MDEEMDLLETEVLRKAKIRYFIGGLAAGLFAVSVVLVGVLIGSSQKKLNVSEDSAISQETLQKMQVIEQIINMHYYKDEDISAEAISNGIYKGMVQSLGDAYSAYYTQEELSALLQHTQGVYYGIGASVSIDTATSYPKIVTIYEGTPAEEAGLREEDIIYEVAGESTYGLDLTTVVSKIKGEEDTWINLTIVRDGQPDYLSIDVQRRKVDVPTVEYEMLEDGMAYILISEFDDVTVDQFTDKLAMARGNGMKGLILDLRGNPGGSLDSVIQIAQRILPKGLIVYTEDKYGYRNEYMCDGKREITEPLVVLINGNSASASEILAGAVKDYGIGTLVGTTTFGKGIVQSAISLNDGTAVKLTISTYFTPNGNNIHGVGVTPDVECEFDVDAYYEDPSAPDNQLEKAKEVLRELIEG